MPKGRDGDYSLHRAAPLQQMKATHRRPNDWHDLWLDWFEEHAIAVKRELPGLGCSMGRILTDINQVLVSWGRTVPLISVFIIVFYVFVE